MWPRGYLEPAERGPLKRPEICQGNGCDQRKEMLWPTVANQSTSSLFASSAIPRISSNGCIHQSLNCLLLTWLANI